MAHESKEWSLMPGNAGPNGKLLKPRWLEFIVDSIPHYTFDPARAKRFTKEDALALSERFGLWLVFAPEERKR